MEWDYRHGDVEVYDRKGQHIGSARANDGQIYKPPVSNRSLNSSAVKVGTAALILWGLYEGIKWGGAVLLAPESGGGSLVLAGMTP